MTSTLCETAAEAENRFQPGVRIYNIVPSSDGFVNTVDNAAGEAQEDAFSKRREGNHDEFT